jgi:hypothetical protein
MKKTCIFLLFFFSYTFSNAQITEKEENQTPKATQPGDLKILQSPYRSLDSSQIRTGILYDNIIPFSKIDDYSGAKRSKAASKDLLEQVYLELSSASVTKTKFKSFTQLEAASRTNEKVIPLAILNFKYNKIKADALAKGLLLHRNGKIIPGSAPSETPYLIKRAFVAAPLREYTFRGSNVTFRLNTELYLTNLNEKPARVKIDFQDNQGFREVRFDQDIRVHYATTGSKTILVEITTGDQAVLHSSFGFKVRALTAPDPVDYGITAKIPYQGVGASGTAYLYLSPRNTQVTNPIVVVEGLDIDNSWNADTLYATFNQHNLAENLRQQGYDIIIVNFTDATTYIQANAFMLVEWIDYLNTYLKAGDNPNVVIGASMGAVVARYALRYMETNNMAHETGLFVSFDGPQQGANISLGDQYLIKYFAVNPAAPNAEAQEKLNGLNSIAAQQLLVYHHLVQPDNLSIPLPNALRLNFVSELSTFGYPQACRNVAISNGAAAGTGQLFQPGDQFIKYYYKSFWVDIDAKSYAVPHSGPATIAYLWLNPWDLFGMVHYKFEKKVVGTAPYDNAPGSTRPTNKEIADSEVRYGDIKALISDHCFIPTTSSLDIKTVEPSGEEPYFTGLLNQNLFYNIEQDPDILKKTPFHAIYFPTAPTPEFPQVHQSHLAITSETVSWIRQELDLLTTPPASARVAVAGVTAAEKPVRAEKGDIGFQVYPNPAANLATVALTPQESGLLLIQVFDLQGRLHQQFFGEPVKAGSFYKRQLDTAALSSGVYLVRLVNGKEIHHAKLLVSH